MSWFYLDFLSIRGEEGSWLAFIQKSMLSLVVALCLHRPAHSLGFPLQAQLDAFSLLLLAWRRVGVDNTSWTYSHTSLLAFTLLIMSFLLQWIDLLNWGTVPYPGRQPCPSLIRVCESAFPLLLIGFSIPLSCFSLFNVGMKFSYNNDDSISSSLLSVTGFFFLYLIQYLWLWNSLWSALCLMICLFIWYLRVFDEVEK